MEHANDREKKVFKKKLEKTLGRALAESWRTLR
jgi:hypothetical protein